MSRTKRGRISSGPAFTQLYHWIRKTDAWRSLGPYSRLLYIEIRARYTGANNGDISYSYRQAEEDLNCSNKPVPVAFFELQDRGFIKAVQKGTFTWKVRFEGKGRATTWLLTELPQDYPERSLAPSYEFKTWQPPPAEEIKTRHAKSGPDARRGRAISQPMARLKRANGTQKAGHLRPNGEDDGTLKAGTSISTIPLQPVGQVTQQLLRSRLVQGK